MAMRPQPPYPPARPGAPPGGPYSHSAPPGQGQPPSQLPLAGPAPGMRPAASPGQIRPGGPPGPYPGPPGSVRPSGPPPGYRGPPPGQGPPGPPPGAAQGAPRYPPPGVVRPGYQGPPGQQPASAGVPGGGPLGAPGPRGVPGAAVPRGPGGPPPPSAAGPPASQQQRGPSPAGSVQAPGPRPPSVAPPGIRPVGPPGQPFARANGPGVQQPPYGAPPQQQQQLQQQQTGASYGSPFSQPPLPAQANAAGMASQPPPPAAPAPPSQQQAPAYQGQPSSSSQQRTFGQPPSAQGPPSGPGQAPGAFGGPPAMQGVNAYQQNQQPKQPPYPPQPAYSSQASPGGFAPPPTQQMQQMSMGGAPPPPPPAAPQGTAGAAYAPPARTMAGVPQFGTQRRIYPQASYPPNQPPQLSQQQGGPPLPGQPAPPPAGFNVGGLPQLGVPQQQQPLQPSVHSSPSSRIDPNQIPRPQAPAGAMVFETRVNNAANMPPSAMAAYVVKDTGNCSPRFMRCTLNQVPCTGDLLASSGMPLALMVQPMALMDPAEEPIQVVDFGEGGPVRCQRCKAYINPFMKFIDSGRQFICNLCSHTNETPRDYMCNLGPDGRRRDVDERPELCRGTVEFAAPKDYQVRDPMPPAFFFLVDVSANAVSTGAVAAACSSIKRVLSDLPGGNCTMVGFATFDNTIHFYSLKPSQQQPSMLVVPDIHDVYTPLPSDLLVPLPDAKERLEQLLDAVPGMFKDQRTADSAFGAAIQGAFLAMKASGGKLLVFQSVLPSVGLAALSAREAAGRNATVGEKDALKLLQPLDKALKHLAFDFADYQVCVDLFLTTQGYVDVASLAVVSRDTGGQVYHYLPFQVETDTGKLLNDLRWNVCRPQGLESILKVRCSNGLSVQAYHGNYHKRIPGEVYMPNVDCDKTIMATFKYDDKLADASEAAFQSAILYTTMTGERRVRVHTLSLPTTTVLSSLFRGADLDSQVTYFTKHAASLVLLHPLTAVRELVNTQCVAILHVYRKFCATSSGQAQLILPEALKVLPLYTLALTKSVGLRADKTMDERSCWIARANSISAPAVIPFVYPRMFAMHEFVVQEGGYSPAIEGLPPSIPLSSEKLAHDGVFLLENGEDALLWVAKGVHPELLSQLFGVSSFEEIATGAVPVPELNNHTSKRLHALLNEIRRQRCSFLRLRVTKRGDPSESAFLSFLVEDRSGVGQSYVEYLVYVHRQIQNRMT